MRFLVLGVVVPVAVGVVAAQGTADVAGRDLAATCASCHGTVGASAGGIDSLAGRPKEELLTPIRAFKSGALVGTVMPQLAKGYTDEQIDVVCAWFAAQRPAR
jgi:sulfide dehydrogenase cytochrome subunit